MNKQLLIQNQVALDIPETIPEVYADEKALLFVLNQIIYNAVTYKRVGVTPKITFFWQTPGEDKLLLHIQDNGRGISSEDLPRVFEKGFTGKNGRENHRSTGMGLYLCKKICDRLGTDLGVCSEEGVYTRFTICLQILTEK